MPIDVGRLFARRLTAWQRANPDRVAGELVEIEVVDDPLMPPKRAASVAVAPDITVDQVVKLTREQLRSRRARDVRKTTVSVKRLSMADLARGAEAYPEDTTSLRPKTRGECVGGERPCPFVSCRWNLYLDVSPKTGAIIMNFPDLEVSEMRESCALDVADRDGATLEECGALMNITRERIRQIENKAMKRIEQLDKRKKVLVDFANPGDLGRRTIVGGRSTDHASRKARAIELHRRGLPTQEIAATMGVPHLRAAEWLREAKRDERNAEVA